MSVFPARQRNVNANNSAALTGRSTPLIMFSVNSAPSMMRLFFFNDTATTEFYTLSLHDALPISRLGIQELEERRLEERERPGAAGSARLRSEEHTSELQSQSNLVCRLLLEKKNISFV